MSAVKRSHDWIRSHRRWLIAAWAAIGVLVVAAMAAGPEVYYLRGIAPWPRGWALAFFLSLWAWAALRFIALWKWAWLVMAAAPVSLFLPIHTYLDAWWLQPLLAGITLISGLTVLVVVSLALLRRRPAAPR